MTAGQLRDRVVIRSPANTPDGVGGVVATPPVTVATVAAHVDAVPMRGTERLRAMGMASALMLRVTIRYRGDVTPSMELVWTPYRGTEQVLQIHVVEPLEAGRDWLVLDCAVAQ